jgi:hypothetical protein
VTEIGISYVRIETADGLIQLPNSQVLASAVGPAHQNEPAGAGGPAPAQAADGNAPPGPPPVG